MAVFPPRGEVMNFMGMLKRDGKLDKAFEELQTGMLDVLDEDLFSLPDTAQPADDIAASEETTVMEEVKTDEHFPDGRFEEPQEPAVRLTSYAQGRMAALESLEELHRNAHDHLESVGSGLAEIITSHHLTREFLNAVHSDIHRASELEATGNALAAENRKLSEQLHDALRKQQELETALEALRRRETGLLQDRDALRIELSSLKLENVELGNNLSRTESERGDLVKTLSTRTVEAERRLRENEMLREKQVNLSIDLEKALKRETELRRKFDEVSAGHSNETMRHRETQATLTKTEKEIIRLQKQVEIAEAKQAELHETAIGREAESEAEQKRGMAEIRGLKDEIQSLHTRLETASASQADASEEIARLKSQLDDMATDKQITQETIATLKRESEADKKSLAALGAGRPDMSGMEKLEGEIANLTGQISKLKAEIKELQPYQRLYREAKAKLQAANTSEAEEPASKKKHHAEAAKG
jgi:chromosome segregation ATPase